MKFIMLSHIIWKLDLSPNSFKLYCVCLMFANKATGRFIAKVETIANRCGMSGRSIARGMQELIAKGLIKKNNRVLGGHYIASEYTVARFNGRFTKVSIEAIQMPVNAHAFVIYTFMLKCADKARKAFPSLRGIAMSIGQSLPTINKHLKKFDSLKIISKTHYKKRSGSFGHNQYVVGIIIYIFNNIINGIKKRQTPQHAHLQRIQKEFPIHLEYTINLGVCQ